MSTFFHKHKKILLDNLLWLSWAVLYAFVYPIYNLPILIWFIFIPVLIYVYKNPVYKSLRFIFYYSIVFWLMTLFWLIAFHPVSMPFITPIYSMYNALALLVVVVLAKKYKKIRFLFLPLAWVSIELLRSSGYQGFKWNLVGDALWQTPILMQTADIWGIYGVSFIILLVNSVLAEVIISWIKNGDILKSLRKNKLSLSITAGLMTFVLVYGVIRYNQFEKITEQSAQERVALMQPNQPSFETNWYKKRWEYYYDIWELHAEASLEEPDIIVWSEIMFKSFVFRYDNYNPRHPIRKIIDRHMALATEFDVPILMTHPVQRMNGAKREYLNSVDFVQPGQTRGEVFSKIHLTPFGEWFPLYEYIPLVNTLMKDLGAGQYSPSTDFKIFHTKKAKFAAMICFEDIFGLMARKYVRRGMNYFLNSTNDGWAYRWNRGSTYPLWQHIAGVVGVSISVRRPIARAVNTGVSGIVDASGNIRISPVPLYKKGVFVDDIAIIDENIQTIYVRFGYLFPYAVLIILLAFVVHLTLISKKKGII